MDRSWFRKFGPVYVPKSAIGWWLSLLTGFISVRTSLWWTATPIRRAMH
jgi:hypothetical protein